MTPDEIAAFHRWKNEEAPKRLMRGISELVICEVWDVQYDPSPEGKHWIELRRRRDAMNRLLREQAGRDDRKQTVVKAAWDKVSGLLTGFAIALGVGWLATKLGVKLPGVTQ